MIDLKLRARKLLFDKLWEQSYIDEKNPRVVWLRSFRDYVIEEDLKGNVAECGVFRGHFAFWINKYFSNKKLYLCDTFVGFIRDELEEDIDKYGTMMTGDTFKGTDSDFILSKMPNRHNCIIKKGHFPHTVSDLDDSFCFVNLDMDLYRPQLNGLIFFWNKMVTGGVILLHDYFHSNLQGVKGAVNDFEKMLGYTVPKIPIADFCSIAIIKAGA